MNPFRKSNLTLLMMTATVCTLSLATLAGCAKSAPGSGTAAIVSAIHTEVLSTVRPSANTDLAPTTTEVKVTTVVDKNALLSQEFLYGADLQYSSLYDKGMDLYQQSLAIGHIPARFRIAGDELLLVADNKRLYPSEVNHPEQLLSRYKILAQTDKALTISGANSGVFLAQIFGGLTGSTNGGLSDPTAKPPRDLWIRSFEFAPKGSYLLQQTSVVLDDGSIGEFMESVFPRTTLDPGAIFEKFEMDPENPIGGDADVFDRFRLLPGEPNFNGEHKFAMAQHFDISKTDVNPQGTIDWYVTPNVTDEEIVPVGLAVEGWNRYFKKEKGVERDVVLFKGRLPEGIHLGDPRYNVINWDSRLIAGAAYETQATDPATGKQSHSLIYMPAAWLQIGFKYWTNGQYSEPQGPVNESVSPAALAQAGGAVKVARLSCLRDMRGAAALLASGRLSQDEVKTFGVRLLKGTLFHEVGHALGLAHNFKGSLSFDRSNPKSIFSTSIMDYNDYEIERGAFPAVDSADGPELEYDRQILSRIYNKGTDIATGAPVVPMCNDAEADNEDGGVDPLCVRYDLEKDPTLSIGTALDRINLATQAGDVTMSQSVSRVPGIVLTQDALAAVKTEQQLKALAKSLAAGLKGSMQFYLVSGKASLAYVMRTNAKSLLQFAEDVLPAGYEERVIRERVFGGVQKALALRALPDTAKAALVQAEKDSLEALAKTPYIQGLASDQGRKVSEDLAKAIHAAVMTIETDTATGLPKIRNVVLAALARHPKVPFFFGKLPGMEQPLDLEATIVGILGDSVTASGTAAGLTASERVTAAKALATFRGRAQGDAALEAVKAALLKARTAATDNDSRELVEALLAALKPAQASSR